MSDRYESTMRRAIEIANREHPHPNPRVGAAILDAEGRIVAEGAHVEPGTPHAERLAIAAANRSLEGMTIVVTLEPCVHQGRTPPCTDALIEAGFRRVVIGARDPDVRVSGRSATVLREAGIEVIEDVLADVVVANDPGYFHQRTTGLPLLTLKTAMTLDGQTAALDGSSQWITSDAARHDVHKVRAAHDAVLIGAGTMLADDPLLDVRIANYAGPQPTPVVVAGKRRLNETARLWQRSPIVLAPQAVETPSGKVLDVGDGLTVDLERGLRALCEEGILTVLVEGGAAISAALWAQGLIDRGITYVGARMAGGIGKGMFESAFETMSESIELVVDEVTRIGPDFRVDWHQSN